MGVFCIHDIVRRALRGLGLQLAGFTVLIERRELARVPVRHRDR